MRPSRNARLKRLDALVREASVTDEQVHLIVGRNVDASALPDVPGVPVPQPSVEHTIAVCAVCRDAIWLGPMQIKAKGIRTCCICCVIYCASQDEDVPIISLNPDADKIPRRT